MADVRRLKELKSVWRIAILYVLLIAFIGPWGFDRIHVPSQYECTFPTFRLEGDFCGTPLSGMRAFAVGLRLVADALDGVRSGVTFAPDLYRNLWGLFILLAPLPAISTTLLFLPGQGRWRQFLQVGIWALAVAGGFGFLFLWHRSMPGWPPIQMLGLWIYLAAAPLALILEGRLLCLRRGAPTE